ncbi:MAG: hypothetical protein R2932_11385 [Caldilineaceae bacterium]
MPKTITVCANPREVSTYALTGVKPSAAFFTLADLQALQLSQLFQSSGTPVADISAITNSPIQTNAKSG